MDCSNLDCLGSYSYKYEFICTFSLVCIQLTVLLLASCLTVVHSLFKRLWWGIPRRKGAIRTDQDRHHFQDRCCGNCQQPDIMEKSFLCWAVVDPGNRGSRPGVVDAIVTLACVFNPQAASQHRAYDLYRVFTCSGGSCAESCVIRAQSERPPRIIF